MKRIKQAIQLCLEVQGIDRKAQTELVGVQFVEAQAE
jgi:hypothetical protein